MEQPTLDLDKCVTPHNTEEGTVSVYGFNDPDDEIYHFVASVKYLDSEKAAQVMNAARTYTYMFLLDWNGEFIECFKKTTVH